MFKIQRTQKYSAVMYKCFRGNEIGKITQSHSNKIIKIKKYCWCENVQSRCAACRLQGLRWWRRSSASGLCCCATICTFLSKWGYSIVQVVNYKYYICNITGCPKKNVLIECCWSNGAQAQSRVVGTTWAWKVFFWSFLTKTRQDQAPPSHVHDKF